MMGIFLFKSTQNFVLIQFLVIYGEQIYLFLPLSIKKVFLSSDKPALAH